MNEWDCIQENYVLMNREVAFSDTDIAGMVHFSKAPIYAEDAEHDLLRQLGLTVYNSKEGWPRVNLNVSYKAPLRLGQVKVGIRPHRVGETSIVWDFCIWQDNLPCVMGEYVVVHVDEVGEKKEIDSNMRICLTSGFSKLLAQGK